MPLILIAYTNIEVPNNEDSTKVVDRAVELFRGYHADAEILTAEVICD